MLEKAPVDDWLGIPLSFVKWFEAVRIRAGAVSDSGTTANRPTSNLYVGRPYFDTTLGIPIWCDDPTAPSWVDATGLSV